MLLVFAFVQVGCATTDRNIIGVITDDNYALVRATTLRGFNSSGLRVRNFAGTDLTGNVWARYKVTQPFFMGGDDTIDLKIPPGIHEFTLDWMNDGAIRSTATGSYNFEAGKWYEFKSHILFNAFVSIAMNVGTLDNRRPRGATEEVARFELQ